MKQIRFVQNLCSSVFPSMAHLCSLCLVDREKKRQQTLACPMNGYSNCVIWMRNKTFHTKTRSWRRQPQRQWKKKKLTRVIVFLYSFDFEAEKVLMYAHISKHTSMYLRNSKCIYLLSERSTIPSRSIRKSCTFKCHAAIIRHVHTYKYKHKHRRNYGEMLLQNCIFVQLYSQISCNFHWVCT